MDERQLMSELAEAREKLSQACREEIALTASFSRVQERRRSLVTEVWELEARIEDSRTPPALVGVADEG